MRLMELATWPVSRHHLAHKSHITTDTATLRIPARHRIQGVDELLSSARATHLGASVLVDLVVAAETAGSAVGRAFEWGVEPALKSILLSIYYGRYFMPNIIINDKLTLALPGVFHCGIWL
jgi:hypothetical protein